MDSPEYDITGIWIHRNMISPEIKADTGKSRIRLFRQMCIRLHFLFAPTRIEETPKLFSGDKDTGGFGDMNAIFYFFPDKVAKFSVMIQEQAVLIAVTGQDICDKGFRFAYFYMIRIEKGIYRIKII